MVDNTIYSYTLIFDSDLEAFQKKVVYFQNKGWVCQGGVSIDNKVFYQAMVKARKII